MLLQLGAAIGIIITYAISMNMRSYTVPLTTLTYEQEIVESGDEYYIFASPVINTDVSWRAGVALLVLSIFCVAPSFLEIVARSMRWLKYDTRMNVWRWMTESIVSAFLATCLVALLGDNTTFSLFTTFVMVHVTQILGLVLEASNGPEQTAELKSIPLGDEGEYAYVSKATTWPLVFSLWISGLGTVIPIVFISTSNDLNYVSGWEWAAMSLYLASGIATTVIQAAYFMHLRKPTQNGFGLFDVTSAEGTYNTRNYDRYNNYLTGTTAVFRFFILGALAFVVTQPTHHLYPTASVINSVFDVCEPSIPTGPDATPGEFQVRHICSQASSHLALLAPGGYSGVDATANVVEGSNQLGPHSQDRLRVTPTSYVDDSYRVLARNFLAFNGVDNQWMAAGTFDLNECAGLSDIGDPPQSNNLLQCFGWVFTSQTISTYNTDLDTYHYGNSMDESNQDVITVDVTTGSMTVTAPAYNLEATYFTYDNLSPPPGPPSVPCETPCAPGEVCVDGVCVTDPAVPVRRLNDSPLERRLSRASNKVQFSGPKTKMPVGPFTIKLPDY